MNTRKVPDYNDFSYFAITDFVVINTSSFTSEQLDKISFAAETELLDRKTKEQFDGESQ